MKYTVRNVRSAYVCGIACFSNALSDHLNALQSFATANGLPVLQSLETFESKVSTRIPKLTASQHVGIFGERSVYGRRSAFIRMSSVGTSQWVRLALCGQPFEVRERFLIFARSGIFKWTRRALEQCRSIQNKMQIFRITHSNVGFIVIFRSLNDILKSTFIDSLSLSLSANDYMWIAFSLDLFHAKRSYSSLKKKF